MAILPANTKYFREAFQLFRQCSKNEDRHDLANKVFEEASASTTNTIKLTKACSRELEQMLPLVTSIEVLESLFDRLTGDELDDLIRDRAACFLLEKFLLRLPNLLNPNNERCRLAFDRLFQCVCEHFDDYIKETGTSHIIAATITFLHPQLEVKDQNEYESLLDAGQTPKQFVSYPSEWNIVEKLRQLAKLMKKSEDYNEFVSATLLRTSGYLRPELYQKLVKRFFKQFESEFTIEQILDKHSSFIYEVLLEFPSEQRETILYPMIINHIDELYLHPVGNFLVQHFLLTVEKKDQIEQIYQSLTNENRLNSFIQQGHIRLLITFIRICERYQYHYEQLIQRIKQSLNNETDFIINILKIRSGQSKYSRKDVIIHKIDMNRLDQSLISKEGSLMVQAFLRARKVDSLTHQSFLSLTGEQISSIACHPSGSHLLCQLILHSSLWPILRRKNFYEKLQPFFTTMACDKAACWFVTQLWKSATTIEDKLHMARSMSNDLSMLRSHTYAKYITYEMNLVAYSSRPEQWRRNVELILKKHSLLDELNVNDDNQYQQQKKMKKQKKHR